MLYLFLRGQFDKIVEQTYSVNFMSDKTWVFQLHQELRLCTLAWVCISHSFALDFEEAALGFKPRLAAARILNHPWPNIA